MYTFLGLFRANKTIYSNQLNRLRIPSGRRQTSWLCTSAAKELNQRLPGTNATGSHRETWTLEISNQRPNHSAMLPSFLTWPWKLIMAVKMFKKSQKSAIFFFISTKKIYRPFDFRVGLLKRLKLCLPEKTSISSHGKPSLNTVLNNSWDDSKVCSLLLYSGWFWSSALYVPTWMDSLAVKRRWLFPLKVNAFLSIVCQS